MPGDEAGHCHHLKVYYIFTPETEALSVTIYALLRSLGIVL